MREILFRGFHPCDGPDTIVVDGEKVKGRWVYGAVARFRGLDNAVHTNIIPEIDGENIMSETVNVLPSTVGQYTGLTDRNGKKVFVGYIVICSEGCPHEVVWVQDHVGTFTGGMPAVYLSDLEPGYAWTGAEEIIGNVHDGEGGQSEEG